MVRRFVVCLATTSFLFFAPPSFATNEQREFSEACVKQNLVKLQIQLDRTTRTLDIDLPLDGPTDQSNCLMFLVSQGNTQGVTLLLNAGANPYLVNAAGDSALTIALKHPTAQYALCWQILHFVDYQRLPDVMDYVDSVKEAPLPDQVEDYPAIDGEVLYSRPNLLLRFMTEQIRDEDSPNEKDSVKAGQPEEYKLARFEFDQVVRSTVFKKEARFVPLGQLCLTHPIILPNTLKKIARRVEAVQDLLRKTNQKSLNSLSYAVYRDLLPSMGPISAVPYRGKLLALTAGNGRVSALNQIFPKTTTIEILHLGFNRLEDQEQFNQVVDRLMLTTGFRGFKDVLCESADDSNSS